IQLSFWICFVRKLECQLDEIFTNYLVKFTFAVFTIIQNSFINNIPAVNSAFVSANNRVDVFTHAFDQNFFRHIITIRVFEKPRWCLRMPKQRMSYNLHTVFFTIFDKLVRILEIENTFLRLHILTFHTVFSINRIEMRLNYLFSLIISFPNLI